jgi:hypothetical protein
VKFPNECGVNVGKYCIAGQGTDDNTTHEQCMMGT